MIRLIYDFENFKALQTFFIDFQSLCVFVREQHEVESYYSIEQTHLEVPDGEFKSSSSDLENQHFSKYVNNFLFHQDLFFSEWYQGFELIGQSNFLKRSSEGWLDTHDSEEITKLIIIGQDTSDGFIADISEQNCPVFLYSEINGFEPQKLADSIYDFVFLLLIREYQALSNSLGEFSYVIFKSDFGKKYDLSKLDYYFWLHKLVPKYEKDWL
jgi:hypothetical protein